MPWNTTHRMFTRFDIIHQCHLIDYWDKINADYFCGHLMNVVSIKPYSFSLELQKRSSDVVDLQKQYKLVLQSRSHINTQRQPSNVWQISRVVIISSHQEIFKVIYSFILNQNRPLQTYSKKCLDWLLTSIPNWYRLPSLKVRGKFLTNKFPPCLKLCMLFMFDERFQVTSFGAMLWCLPEVLWNLFVRLKSAFFRFKIVTALKLC